MTLIPGNLYRVHYVYQYDSEEEIYLCVTYDENDYELTNEAAYDEIPIVGKVVIFLGEEEVAKRGQYDFYDVEYINRVCLLFENKICYLYLSSVIRLEAVVA